MRYVLTSTMEKLPMCRICLVENVRMYVVVNRSLHELYEKLTDIPFVTEDRRPLLACFICCTKLKQCWRLLRKCLEAEEQFAQMMNEDYEPNPLINQDHLEFYSGFIKSPIEHISIVDECQTETIAIKEELQVVCEGLDDIIEPKEEHESDEQEPEHLDNSCLDVADLPPHYSESDFGYDVPLIEFKTGVEEEIVYKRKRRASETDRAPVGKVPKLHTRRTELGDAITVEQTTKEKSKPGTCFNEPFKCDQRSFNPVKNMILNTRSQIGENPKFDVCQRTFSHKSNLTNHIRIHTGEKPYKCDVCQRGFNKKSNLTIHIRIHTGEKPYKCDVCQRCFNQKNSLTNHSLIHTGEKPYKCDICQRSFNQKSNLTNHILIHTGEKSYKCDVCQYSFNQKTALIRHTRKHTGNKPYRCDLCQCRFFRKGDLTTHIRMHTGEKPYKCDVCQHSFYQKSHLTKHIRIHTGEKPYNCDVCQQSFYQKSHLTKHIRIHTGENPYKCNVCHGSFSQKASLTKHMRIHIGE